MKISAWWLIPITVVVVIAAWLFFRFVYEPSETITVHKRKEHDLVTLKLPNTDRAEVFGPKYWEAFHSLAGMIPCSICRDKAVPLEVFKHDVVNLKLDKPVYDRANWKKHVALVNELDKKVS